MKTLFALLAISVLTIGATAQTNFAATANNGSLSNHLDCSTNPCTVVDTRISTSTSSGFTSPSAVVFEHVNGRDYSVGPFSAPLFGRFQFGTGSFLSGSLSGTALFAADQSYVIISSNGYCGQFTMAGICKVGGFTPSTDTLFVGIFEGLIAWQTNLDNSHVLSGTVKGFVNGGTTAVFLNLTATTAPDANPFASNGSLNIITVTIAPF